jgi:homoserine kinase
MSKPFVAGRVRVRVPASCANLGPGFDALGLAVSLYDEVCAEVIADGLAIEVHGEGAESVARDESHLVVRAMRRTLDLLDGAPAGLALDCSNAIPHSRGLGSSAAAIVAGIVLARALTAGGAERLPDGEVLALASDLEGHPDNVAACLLGGLTIAWVAGSARAVRRDLDPAIIPVALVPPFMTSTEIARGLLPDAVPHVDAARNAGRAALLVAALTGTPQAIFDATEDRLHQSYRARGMPESARLLAELRGDGLPAVISGAGPTVLTLARGEIEAEAVRARAPQGWTGLTLAADPIGAQLTRLPPTRVD